MHTSISTSWPKRYLGDNQTEINGSQISPNTSTQPKEMQRRESINSQKTDCIRRSSLLAIKLPIALPVLAKAVFNTSFALSMVAR